MQQILKKQHSDLVALENSAKKINAGDKISIRGYGRIELIEVLGETRKDRIRIVLKKY